MPSSVEQQIQQRVDAAFGQGAYERLRDYEAAQQRTWKVAEVGPAVRWAESGKPLTRDDVLAFPGICATLLNRHGRTLQSLRDTATDIWRSVAGEDGVDVPEPQKVAAGAKKSRKAITDPDILARRREAIAKARQVRAEKLAAAAASRPSEASE